jgi:hypothetical protein
MLIIGDKKTKNIINNMGTNSKFPDGNIPNVIIGSNELAVRIPDNSDMAKKIMSAGKYDLVFDGDVLVSVQVIKTKAQFQKELEESVEFQKKKIQDELSKLDLTIPRIMEDIVEQGKFKIHETTQKAMDRKKELRKLLSEVSP